MPQPTSIAASGAPPRTPAGPTAGSDRVQVLDALRGCALLGVLLVNLRDLTLFDLLPETARAALPTAQWDRLLGWVMALLIDAKAMTIFTILFGVGFALQMERASGGSRLFARRMIVLLGIGLVHAFFWWGDILVLYALCGLLLLLLARLPARLLASLGIAIALFASPILRPWMADWLPKIIPANRATAMAWAGLSGNDWGTLFAANSHHFVWIRISAWGLPFFALGRLLLGAALGFSGALRFPPAHGKLWSRLIWLVPLGFALTTFVMLRDENVTGFTGEWWESATARNLTRIARSGASLSLGLGYVAIFVKLFQVEGWRRWLEIFAPVGRMALTNYLMQTTLGMALFYGVGFGVGPRFGLPGIVLIGATIFVFQLWLSRWWLERFRFGPVEWLWRSLTYGRFFSLRREVV